MSELAQSLSNALSGTLSGELIIFIISMIPILELRGGLLIASLMHIPMFKAVFICIIGNIIPIPFILLFIKKIFALLKKTKLFRPLVEKLENKAMGKSEQVQKYEFLGLLLFVGIPLPGTGAWTGSLIAALLDVDIKKASFAIFLGLILATIIMCLFSYGGLQWIIGLFQ
ncbi:MAG: small multi-drug export protein [Lachnospira sp.]|nr:small multi-drug export protein [Lachnospira sp.]